ncbi:MAG TPA: FAD-dependent oxidoreductase [Salinarimonas sp.]|jgi:hypothetical protein|nr:FAD-dependent oxidoreductase [Salinarimonas sp.]
MRIAVIGAGVAGSAAAFALATGSPHEVVVYEAEGRPGGHSITLDVDLGGRPTPVDMGFIVYNEATYPDFARLLAHLGVASRRADMSFCLADADGTVAWSSRGRLPLPSAGALRLLGDLLRYNRAAAGSRREGLDAATTLGEHLVALRVGRVLRDSYLVPMAAAIWSMPPGDVLAMPARTFVAFFEAHRLLRLRRPAWRTIRGGSRAYVERLAAPWRARLRAGAARVRRHDRGVEIADGRGHLDRFDALVMACHPAQALHLLADAEADERAVLGAIRHRPSEVVLHRDASLMPARRDAWAAWTILRQPNGTGGPAVSYWMNALQGLDPAHPVFVSLDPPRPPADRLTLARRTLSHPQLDAAAIAAQNRLPALQGRRRTWFAGAWTGYGFHEDGTRSGLDAAAALGALLPWRPRARAAA